MDRELSPGRLFKEIDDALRKHGDNDLRLRGLTTSQLSLLLELSDAPAHQLPMKKLEVLLRIAQPTVVGLVSRLEQKDLVRRVTDPEDSRAKIVELTENGLNEALGAKAVIGGIEKRMFSGLTDTERTILMVLLEKVHSSLI